MRRTALLLLPAFVACGGTDEGAGGLPRDASGGSTEAPAEGSDAGKPASADAGGGGGGAAADAHPDAPVLPSSCPWGAQLSANASVGLATSAHVAGGSADERRVLDKMNQQRPAGSPLLWDDCLADLARSHSQDMVLRGYFGHGTAGDSSAFLVPSRGQATAIAGANNLDEDVLMGDLGTFLHGDVGTTVDYWMTDGHKLPILGCDAVGVGIVSVSFMGSTTEYVTADFRCH